MIVRGSFIGTCATNAKIPGTRDRIPPRIYERNGQRSATEFVNAVPDAVVDQGVDV